MSPSNGLDGVFLSEQSTTPGESAPRARRPWPLLALAVALTLGSPASGADSNAQLFAARLVPENFEGFRVGGVDAVAGIDDWALGNGEVCAAIAGLEHESMLSDRGGVLVDLGHCGRADDQWGVLQPVFNLSRDEIIPVDSIRAEVTQGEARIITTGRLHGVRAETVYAVGPAPSAVLTLRTTVEREAEGDAVGLIADIAIHGNGQLAPFTLATRNSGTSLGFEHPEVNIDSPFSAADAMVRADFQVLLGSREVEPQIAYGWRIVDAQIQRRDGRVEALSHLAMNGEHFSILGAYIDTLLWGGEGPPGLLELVQLLWTDLAPGDRVLFNREISLSRTATVAGITDRIWQRGPRVRGRVDAREATLHVYGPENVPITHLESGADGQFEFRLPPASAGAHRIRVLPRAGGETEIDFDVPPGAPSVEIDLRSTPQPGRLALPRGEPIRLTFIGLGETPNPRIRSDRRGFRVGERSIRAHSESNAYSLAGVPGDVRFLDLPAGHYRVLGSRGPLWSLSLREVEIRPGEETSLDIEPPVRLLDHPGWLSADFHVHAAPSDDSGLPLRQRLADFVAMGADLVVATEHDNVFDYAPLIEEMGLAGEIHSLVGVEVTSTYRGSETPHTAGHSNAFPLAPQPEAYRGGAPKSQNRRLARIAEEIHALPGRPILQLNHPRDSGFDSGLGSYFSHLSVTGQAHDPTLPLTAPGNRPLIERAQPGAARDLDFDAMELLNGSSMVHYRIARGDWFSLLLQGEVRTATANSDSHNAVQTVALPVNYVAYTAPRKSEQEGRPALDIASLIDAVRGGRLYGSTGPLLEIRLGERGPGERFEGDKGELFVRVRAAPWVPVDELRIFVNGALAQRQPLGEQREFRISLGFGADAFVTVEVQGNARPGSPYAEVAPGYTPFAFTNPIFVDADGDGHWTAPGLDAPLPPSLTDPLASP